MKCYEVISKAAVFGKSALHSYKNADYLKISPNLSLIITILKSIDEDFNTFRKIPLHVQNGAVKQIALYYHYGEEPL